MHLYNYSRDDHRSMKQDLQLVEDIKFLVTHNQLALREISNEPKKLLYDISRSSFNAMQQIQDLQNGIKQDAVNMPNDKYIKVIKDVNYACLQVIKTSIMATNYSEMMTLGYNEQTQLVIQPASANAFVHIYPKLSLILVSKHSSHFNCL